MSYCVNCGVELEESIRKCPMCNTPVINPNDIEKLKKFQSPYPEKKSEVEIASKKDLIFVLSVIFGGTILCCGALNMFVFSHTKWSLITAGICGLLWFITVPPIIIKNFKKRIYVLYNGLMVCTFLGLIGIFIDDTEWVITLAIPITLITMLFVEIFLTIAKYTRNILPLSTTISLEVGLLCVAIELLIENAVGKAFALTWSAIVLTVTFMLAIIFISIISRKKLRSQLHRRFHL